MEILQQMLERAQANPQRIVLPEGDEPRTLEAANIILRDKIANLILLGSPAVINKMAEEKGYEYVLKGENLTIIDPLTDPKMPEYANLLFELRKAKVKYGAKVQLFFEITKKKIEKSSFFILLLQMCFLFCTFVHYLG